MLRIIGKIEIHILNIYVYNEYTFHVLTLTSGPASSTLMLQRNGINALELPERAVPNTDPIDARGAQRIAPDVLETVALMF